MASLLPDGFRIVLPPHFEVGTVEWRIGAYQGDGRVDSWAFRGFTMLMSDTEAQTPQLQADPLTILERMALERAPGELEITPLGTSMVGLRLRKDGREAQGIVDLDVLIGAGGDYEKALRAKVARMEVGLR